MAAVSFEVKAGVLSMLSEFTTAVANSISLSSEAMASPATSTAENLDLATQFECRVQQHWEMEVELSWLMALGITTMEVGYNAPINDRPHPPHLGRGGGYVGLRSYNLCPVVGESLIDCLGVKVQLLAWLQSRQHHSL